MLQAQQLLLPQYAQKRHRNTCQSREQQMGWARRRLLQVHKLHRKSTVSGNGTIHSQPQTALVWFKSDLRLDDHPGLQIASNTGSMLPLFCFDPALNTQLLRTPDGLEGLFGAVQALKRQLDSIGSCLVVREGRAEEIIPHLVKLSGADVVVTEEEVEYRLLQSILAVKSKLPQTVALRCWKASLFSDEPFSDNFRQFQKERGNPLEPLPPPKSLPKAPIATTDKILDESLLSYWKDLLRSADEELQSPQIRQPADHFVESWGSGVSGVMQQLARGGEPQAQQIFRQYLAAGALRNADGPLLEAIQESETPATPLGSFPAIFAQTMALGTLSRRRVFWEAQRLLASSKPFLPQMLGVQKTAMSAAVTAEAGDFHWHIARTDRVRDTKTGTAPRHWRWRGFLTDYFTADPQELGSQRPPADKPALMLVHGFGAFGEQWRGQIQALASLGYWVYAPTLPGYGRAEKPSLPYSQELWVSFLRDFVVEVVRRPVVVVGNSIGGFLAASLAADYKQLVQGLVLINSAGLVREGYKPLQQLVSSDSPAGPPKRSSGPPAFVADAISTALLFYLKRTVSSTLSRVYPVNPAMADTWLSGEITRAAGDPGARGVFRSVFYLPEPRALNYLVSELYGGPTLILQGIKDPLQNAKGRAEQMERLCPNVEVAFLDAGHCPFDEVPELCNNELSVFIMSISRAPPAELASSNSNS